MQKFLSRFPWSKICCGLFMAVSLLLLILLVRDKGDQPGVANEPQKVKAKYRDKVRFSRDTVLEFPDFDLIYLGTGVSTSGGMHVPIKSDYFRATKDSKENIVFWTAGTGVIEPIPFEFDGNDYMIEMKYMAYGRDEGKKLGENELSISRAD